MRIKSLTVHGFKSFADRTRVEFHDGLTAIVGPNGCGKSNISDALRWVLGEQRPTAIRGSRMEEAIFGGTEERRPIHRAEVSLELSNEDGSLPVPYSEVVIGRTVYRGGESEYALNGSPCRLKDILDLCRDTGLGANAYAIIENRMIDAILSDRAEERRGLFEEAAEVGRYKDRRRVATRRLEQAENDLQRLEDVLGEVQSKVRSLAQQRGRAERHERLRARLLDLEVAAADARLARTEARLAEARGELAELGEGGPEEDAELDTAELEAETLRNELAELERERSTLAGRAEEARRNVEELERRRLVAEERANAARERLESNAGERERATARAADLAAKAAEGREAVAAAEATRTEHADGERALRRAAEEAAARHEAAAERRESARQALEAARRRLDRFEAEARSSADRARERAEELERRRPTLARVDEQERELREAAEASGARESELAARVVELRGELEDAGAAAEAAEDELRDGRQRAAELAGELATIRARASGLAGLLESSELLPEVVAELLEEGDGMPGVEGVLAEYLDAPAEWAEAVEAHLGPYLHGVVVRDWKTVARVEDWLARRDAAGGVLLLPLDPPPRADTEEDDVGDALLGRVAVRGAGAPWIRALLRGVSAGSGDLEPRESPWVSPGGRRQDRWGAVHLGRPGAGGGVLSRRAALEELHERADELESASSRQAEAVEGLERAAREAQERVERLEDEISSAEAERRVAAGDRTSAASRLERLAEERRELTGRIEQLEAFRDSAEEVSETGEERSAALGEEIAAAETAYEEAADEAEAARDAERAARAALHESQLILARAEADLEGRRDALGRTEETLEEVRGRLAALDEERERLEGVVEEGRDVAAGAEEKIAAGLEARGEREAALRELESRIADRREILGRREDALREARRAERERVKRRHGLELEITRLEGARTSVRERLEAEWDTTLEALRERAEPVEGEPEAWEAELEEVRRSIARIGPVNLLAEQEYDEEKGRLEFLTEQRDDLVAARDDLQSSIRRINRSAAEAFMETFEQVRTHFHRTFDTLFEGGECDVWLEDPDQPLDSDIEISASPRGKKTQRIHLLSGGERALTALALLFAIYLAKPSPFCLLDEVDAPLDETNILRFVHMLEEFKADTQFIVITHNPRTMEGADWIYGVTMQEPGVSSIVGVEFDQADQVA